MRKCMLGLAGALALAGCGGASAASSSSSATVTQTVVEKTVVAAAPKPRTTTVTAPAEPSSPPEPTAGKTQSHTVPDLTGKRLDVAEEDAQEAGVSFKVVGGGVFGVVVPSHWTVCEQDPEAGSHAERVKLIVARSC